MDQKKSSTLIVTYNSEKEISSLLEDLRIVNPGSPVVVIDNASTDNTVDIINRLYPEVQLVQNPQNLGYAKAVNLGFDLCNTPYVFLLNPDIRIPISGLITEMISWLDGSPNTGAIGPQQCMVENDAMHFNFTTSHWGFHSFINHIYYQLRHEWLYSKPIRVPMLNAGCLMIRRSAFMQVGKLNPDYFLYGEEPDLGLKFRRYGYECRLLPNTYVIHYREKSIQTLSARQRRRIRWQAARNISHAILTGWIRIITDYLTLTKLKPY